MESPQCQCLVRLCGYNDRRKLFAACSKALQVIVLALFERMTIPIKALLVRILF